MTYSIREIRENLLPDKDEPKFQALSGMAQELKMIVPEAFLSLELLDKNGKRLSLTHQRSRSWTRNAYNHMFSQICATLAKDNTYAAGKLSIKDTGGTVRYGSNYAGITLACDISNYTFYWELPASSYRQGYLSPAGEAKGIVVGSGSNAESFEDYALQTLIANGTGAGQISYIQSENHVTSYDAGTRTFSDAIARYFNNNSGGNISVNEIALYVVGTVDHVAYTWCQSRDKLPTTRTIPTTGQLKVTYTSTLDYPA